MTRSDLYAGFQTLLLTFFLVVKPRCEELLLLAAYPDYAACRARTRGVLLRRS